MHANRSPMLSIYAITT